MKKFALALGVVALATSATFASTAVATKPVKDVKTPVKVEAKKTDAKDVKKAGVKKEAAVKVTNTKKAAH